MYVFDYWIKCLLVTLKGFLGSSNCKESACNAGGLGSIPGLGRSPGGGHGNPLQYSCLEHPLDREVWQATVLGVAKTFSRFISHILSPFFFSHCLLHISFFMPSQHFSLCLSLIFFLLFNFMVSLPPLDCQVCQSFFKCSDLASIPAFNFSTVDVLQNVISECLD